VLFSFFFTSVGGQRHRHHRAQPGIGMTMLTIIIRAWVLLRFGLPAPRACSS